MIQLYSLIAFGIILFATFSLAIFDHLRLRKLKREPFISIIIPTYNDGDTLEETLESLEKAYDKKKREIIIINDASTDNTKKILEKLKKRYKFQIINNEKNLGKVRSINKAFRFSKGELVFILDSDIRLNRKVMKSLLLRIEKKEVGAVSCRYKVINKGIIPSLLDIQYALLAIGQAAYNFTSALSLWGGCMLFKRKALEEIGLFKENMIIEDMDAALSLGEKGWKVEQSLTSVETSVPSNLKGWFKQQIRWSSGGMQCFLKHPISFLKNPIWVVYFFSFSVLGVIFLYSFFSFNIALSSNLLLGLCYAALSIPYVIMNMKNVKEIYKILWVFPFSFVYYPLFVCVTIIGFIKGIERYFKLRKGGRGW